MAQDVRVHPRDKRSQRFVEKPRATSAEIDVGAPTNYEALQQKADELWQQWEAGQWDDPGRAELTEALTVAQKTADDAWRPTGPDGQPIHGAHYDPATRTVTMGRKNCGNCREGTVPSQATCPACHGTGNGPKGGARGCQACGGLGWTWDPQRRETCPQCGGHWEDAEASSLYDHVPRQMAAQIAADMPVRVIRQDRDASWNEQFMGANRLWTAADYGAHWSQPDKDDALIADVREGLAAPFTLQWVKLVEPPGRPHAKTASLVPGLAVVVTRGGYSVMPDDPAQVERATRELGRVEAEVIGGRIAADGGDGTGFVANYPRN